MIVVATLNVVCLVSSVRKQWLLELLLEKRVDLACAQETKLETIEQKEKVREHFKEYVKVFIFL